MQVTGLVIQQHDTPWPKSRTQTSRHVPDPCPWDRSSSIGGSTSYSMSHTAALGRSRCVLSVGGIPKTISFPHGEILAGTGAA